MVTINNKDNFCLIRAFLLAIYNYNDDEYKDKYQSTKLKEFDDMVHHVANQCGIKDVALFR